MNLFSPDDAKNSVDKSILEDQSAWSKKSFTDYGDAFEFLLGLRSWCESNNYPGEYVIWDVDTHGDSTELMLYFSNEKLETIFFLQSRT